MRREYKKGTKWCVWRWKYIYWDKEIYLRRLYIARCPLFSIMIHFIDTPDKQRHLHDHPIYMLCFVLKGWYVEELEGSFDSPDSIGRVRWINWVTPHKKHRIILTPKDGAVTLCFAGPSVREWGFHTEDGWVGYQEYQRLYEGSTS